MSEKDHRDFLKKLKYFEGMRIAQVVSANFRDFTIYNDFDQCPNRDSKRRLSENIRNRGDVARFRLGGTKRLYGILHENEFHILWWDPQHEVWPSTPRHT